ncbi:hypothetical protein RvY_13255 [Ramazzottius varieornatus]|uniref:Uncharacterized protein n=1 Tax=Ramazzottius varieornatus TaxID=947166 RepID=A0A1D1VPG6_RAMVA|nr:hypothetical protein RvY_13255 [Ramazzottius varieornatus]
MASVLFRPEVGPSFGACSNADPPAKLGHNYWTTAAPHRTALTPSSAFYVDKTKLAEYQRYFGPESTKKLVHCWPAYLKALVQHVAGGEESYMRALLDIRKTDPGSPVLDPVLLDDIFEHMVLLYKSPNVVKPRARIALLRFSSHQLELYDKGTTRWHFPDLDDRPKPEVLVLLEEQEYWRKPAPDRTQLRPGHEVYIGTKILESIASYFGPQSNENCIKQYSYAVLAHMMGGVETALKLKAAKTFAEGVRSMFLLDDVIAVALHADEVFHLRFSVNPSDIIVFTGVKLVRLTESRTRNRKRPTGRSARKREPKNLLHFALSVT